METPGHGLAGRRDVVLARETKNPPRAHLDTQPSTPLLSFTRARTCERRPPVARSHLHIRPSQNGSWLVTNLASVPLRRLHLSGSVQPRDEYLKEASPPSLPIPPCWQGGSRSTSVYVFPPDHLHTPLYHIFQAFSLLLPQHSVMA